MTMTWMLYLRDMRKKIDFLKYVCFPFIFKYALYTHSIQKNVAKMWSPYIMATLAQLCSCVEPSLAFATGTTSKHQRVTWLGV